VLREGASFDQCQFPGDELATTLHLGAFSKGTKNPVGIVTFMPSEIPFPFHEFFSGEQIDSLSIFQLRGMAVHPHFQNKKIGQKLVQQVLFQLQKQGASLIWCNARKLAVPFYLREGFTVMGNEFMIETVGPHFFMQRSLSNGK
jgi:GNAT superfamily N-acetyltransferase